MTAVLSLINEVHEERRALVFPIAVKVSVDLGDRAVVDENEMVASGGKMVSVRKMYAAGASYAWFAWGVYSGLGRGGRKWNMGRGKKQEQKKTCLTSGSECKAEKGRFQ
ncbi:hypothetical protein CVT25_008396 [Psilocybe cyanescens]|uniref:Uncharacterized protein n=1 Tax=Psilocybe cyanescens TaxID=93625 RepID=A0A409XMS2_PSICY|nr:hypothetical protein CVT25_008396 [Psilocybe cyanescens]